MSHIKYFKTVAEANAFHEYSFPFFSYCEENRQYFLGRTQSELMWVDREAYITPGGVLVGSVNFVDKEFNQLSTDDKTCIGAINELNTIFLEASKAAESEINSVVSDIQVVVNQLKNVTDQVSGISKDIETMSDSVSTIQTGIDQLGHESGIVSPEDSYAWYTLNEGMADKTMRASYTTLGDYCTLFVNSCHLCANWHVVYYSLPVAPIEAVSIVGQSSAKQSVYIQTLLHEGVAVMELSALGSTPGLKEGIVDFVLTYKYK